MGEYTVIVGEDNVAREFDNSILIEREFARHENLANRREPYDPAWSFVASLPATRTDERYRYAPPAPRVQWNRCEGCGVNHPATYHDKRGGAI